MPRHAIWREIEDTLKGDLAEGRYPPGARLPSEAALSDRFGVNRHTVRRALSAMQDAGLVHARRGAGVFVTARPTVYPIGRRVSFRANLEAAGRTGSSRLLSVETTPATQAERAALGLAVGAAVHVSQSLSLADGAPIAVARAVFPADRFPDLHRHLSEGLGVTAAFRAVGLTDYFRATTDVTTEPADRLTAGHLQIPVGAPVLVTDAVNVDDAGQPVQHGLTRFAGDKVRLVFGDGA